MEMILPLLVTLILIGITPTLAVGVCVDVKVTDDAGNPATYVPVDSFLAYRAICCEYLGLRFAMGISKALGWKVDLPRGRVLASDCCITDENGECRLCLDYDEDKLNVSETISRDFDFLIYANGECPIVPQDKPCSCYPFENQTTNCQESEICAIGGAGIEGGINDYFFSIAELGSNEASPNQLGFFDDMSKVPTRIKLSVNRRLIFVQVKGKHDMEVSSDDATFAPVGKCSSDCVCQREDSPPKETVSEIGLPFGTHTFRYRKWGQVFSKTITLGQGSDLFEKVAPPQARGTNNLRYSIANSYCYLLDEGEFSASSPPTQIEEKVLICGDLVCEKDEDSMNCCLDCGCPSDQSCISGNCIEKPKLSLVFVPVNWETKDLGLLERIWGFITGEDLTRYDFDYNVEKQAEMFIKSTNLNQCMGKVEIAKQNSACKVDLNSTTERGRFEVLANITRCAANQGEMPQNKRIIGLTNQKIPGALGYTCRSCQTAIANVDIISVSAHELGHTFGLCDEYNYTRWEDENKYPRCPNAFPDYCTKNGTIRCEGEICGENCRCIMGSSLNNSVNRDFGSNCKRHLGWRIKCE